VAKAKALLSAGEFEQATAAAERALEVAPVPEAEELYEEAEQRLSRAVGRVLEALEGRLELEVMPASPPSSLTATDVSLHAEMGRAPGLRRSLEAAELSGVPAYRSVRRLIEAGVLRLRA
jgi:hypothetical protein